MRQLSRFSGSRYDKGRSPLTQATWVVAQALLFRPVWVPAEFRVWLLRRFGANIGRGVLVRHRVRVLWPWKLTIGDHSWVGEGVWILNLEDVRIGHNTCISQEAVLCTGSHDRRSPTFEFDNGPIVIGDGAWIGLRATILRGVTIGNGATVGASALVASAVADGATVVAPAATVAHTLT